MSSHIEDGRRPVVGARAVHRENARIREIAQLRARRAARLANERAAGQRRLLASAATALATVVVVVLAAVSVLGWVWVALPAALLAAALATSRWAAVRSEAAGRREDARLRQLREGLDSQGGRVPSGGGGASGSVRVPSAGAPMSEAPGSVSGAADEGGAVAPDEGEGTALGSPGEAGRAAGIGSPLVGPLQADTQLDRAGGNAGAEEAAELQEVDTPREAPVGPGAAAVGRRTWDVSAVPTPTYASRARVVGREVHSDTDLRGIPAVDAAVPARPAAAGRGAGDARSTEDVVASQPVVFDLDAVLDNRRAQ